MIEITFYGRGGQGAVTAADVLATAAFLEGKHPQSFPSFSGERRGAPVMAFARIAEQALLNRNRITKADYVIVLDPNLLKIARPLSGLKEKGRAIINIDRSAEDLQREIGDAGNELFCIDASSISEEIYGKRALPITNIAMLGAFSAVSNSVQLDSIILAVDNFFSGVQAEDAKKTARMAYKKMGGTRKS
jgi:2-oxoacid:acceptor oxidoreductase gamma subunit (pyruvate/2-ketoisovalerate family)